MTDKLRAAAQAALEMLDNDDRDCAFAANILRAALAEPAIKESLTGAEQKPMLEMNPQKREFVGLTGPEVDAAYKSVSDKEWAIGGLTDARVFFCAIEAKLREKNT
jgi:hypothetical protein